MRLSVQLLCQINIYFYYSTITIKVSDSTTSARLLDVEITTGKERVSSVTWVDTWHFNWVEEKLDLWWPVKVVLKRY